MTNTIAGTYSTLVTLGSASDNPTTITATGKLKDGLSVTYQYLNVINAGSIASAGPNSVSLYVEGTLTNQTGAAISGASAVVGYAIDTVVNAGSIAGSAQGVALEAGGSVINQTGGSIISYFGVFGVGNKLTVVNSGVITGSTARQGTGVQLLAGGSVTNQSGGVISATDAVTSYNGDGDVTVVNAGTISGTKFAVRLAADYANRLVFDPGAVFSGTVSGGNPVGALYASTLEMASGSSVGTLSGLGTQFVDFAQVTVDAGAQWTLAGADILRSGYVLTNAGTLDGTLTLAAGGVLTNAATGTVTTSGTAAIYGTGGASTVVNAGVITNSNAASSDAVDLAGGGSVINQSGGTISGDVGSGDVGSGDVGSGDVGIAAGGAVTVANTGSVSGVVVGILADAAATVTNAGSISGAVGIAAAGVASVVNTGLIAGSDTISSAFSGTPEGVYLKAGGSVTNLSGGTISGYRGIYGTIAAVSVVNAGSIAGNSTVGSGAGIFLAAGGSVTNQSGGAISGVAGIAITGAATVVNAGIIIGADLGVIDADGAATVVNSGTITGSAYAVDMAAGYANRLVIAPNAVFSGTVTGGNAIGATSVSTLELASGSSAGTLSGVGTQYVDFAQITVDGGAQWTLAAANTLAAGYSVTDAGTLTNAAIINGEVTVAAGGVLTNAAAGTITTSGSAAVYGGAGAAAAVVNAGVIYNGITSFGTYAIDLQGGGIVTNLSGGTIGGAYGAIASFYTHPAATVVNAGLITAPQFAVNLGSGGSVTNESTGTITGKILTWGTNAVVDNLGIIDGTPTYRYGVGLAEGGLLINGTAGGTASSATIGDGVNFGRMYEADSLANYGTIGGGVYMPSGTMLNGPDGATGALIEGPVRLDRGTVINYGTVINNGQVESELPGIGFVVVSTGTISNLGSASLIQGLIGIYTERAGGSTVINAGTIAADSATGYAIVFGAGTNRLIVDPGATFIGTVSGSGPVNANFGFPLGTNNGIGTTTLELASGGSAGTLSGLGTKYAGFAGVTVDAGAQWTLAGSNTLGGGGIITNAGTLTLSNATLGGAAGLINNGEIVLDPSSMTIASLTGSGSVTIEAGSTLDVTGVIASTETIVFAGSGALLQLGTPDSVAGSVTGFAAGDTIDLGGIAPGSVSNAGGTVSFTGGSFPLAASIPLVVESDGNGGTDMVPCFAEGTRIATPDGWVTVEALQAGDRVLTASGGVRPVRWIGFRTIDPTRHPAPGQVQPIRIVAGAFAPGVPSRDLRLSPDHAVLLGGLLIPIKLLRNDSSVTQETECRSVTYYHVELDVHDILLAEGLAAESYLDTGNRAMFANAGRPMRLHPDFANDQARRELGSCAPFADRPPAVEPIWRTLAARAEQMGLAAPPTPETTDDPALHLLVDGLRRAPLSVAHGRYTFLVAGNASQVRLVSRHAVRPDTAPWIADSRRLGVQLRAMTIQCGSEVSPVPLDHPLLADGWWAPEWHAATRLRRWTTGDAVVPMLGTGRGPRLLEVKVSATVPYPLVPAARETGARHMMRRACKFVGTGGRPV